jgi:hypothetical protein
MGHVENIILNILYLELTTIILTKSGTVKKAHMELLCHWNKTVAMNLSRSESVDFEKYYIYHKMVGRDNEEGVLKCWQRARECKKENWNS